MKDYRFVMKGFSGPSEPKLNAFKPKKSAGEESDPRKIYLRRVMISEEESRLKNTCFLNLARPVDKADVPPGVIHIGYLKGRVLPVAAAKFLDDIIHQLQLRFPDETGV